MDCCTFVGEIAEKFSEKPLHIADWKKVLTYRNATDSQDAVTALGGEEVLDLPTIVFGVERRDISDVKHGDIVYAITIDGEGTLGVCNGVRAYFLAKGKGLTAILVKDCLYCWSPK